MSTNPAAGVHDVVARSRAAQGLPGRVTDPAVLAKVAGIVLAARNDNAGPHHKAGGANFTITTTAASARRGSRGPE